MLTEENRRLKTDYELLEETRYLLQERLAFFGAETAALDTQLRALFAPGAGPVPSGLLELAQRCGRCRRGQRARRVRWRWKGTSRCGTRFRMELRRSGLSSRTGSGGVASGSMCHLESQNGSQPEKLRERLLLSRSHIRGIAWW